MNHEETLVIDTTKKLLDTLGIVYSDVSVTSNVEERSVSLLVKGEDIGILIGFHGKNIEAVKTILSLMVNRELGRENSVRIFLDVNDYSAKREEQLKAMIENAVMMMESKQLNLFSLPPMSPADRRRVHTIANDMSLKTESEGDDRDRHVNILKA